MNTMEEKNNLESQIKEYKEKLYNVYYQNKALFIKSEEYFSNMSLFLAPVIEHRDALDHIMRYFKICDNGMNESVLEELDKALSHELRAYFDIADYICITIRQYINNRLKRVSRRKIKKVWKDYSQVKEDLFKLSEEIAQIRNHRNSSLDNIEKYSNVINGLFDTYKVFVTEIEGKL